MRKEMFPVKHRKMVLLAAAALLVTAALSAAAFAADPVQAGPGIAVTQTVKGKVQGYIDRGVRVYKGIPYARAERFMPPEEVPAWQGIRPALDYGPVVPQGSFPAPSQFYWPRLPAVMSEEGSLNLNVWAPADASEKNRKAVMVWLHGGGFSTGSSIDLAAYDGRELARKHDVVLVSVNHRLNVLGYLNLSAYGEKYRYSANVGIMDLTAALTWVHDNIANFGGDPQNVTIFGQSGGGAKVLTLMAVPAARGLFQKAIEQSGALEGMGMTLFPVKMGQRIARCVFKNLGLKDGDVAALQKTDYQKLRLAGERALQQVADEFQIPEIMGSGRMGLSWAPTMDGDYIPAEPVGESYPAMAKDIPLLIGSNLTEWETVPGMRDILRSAADNPGTWDQTRTEQKMKEKYGDKAAPIAAAFSRAYPWRKPGDAVFVDTFLRLPALKTARLKADQQGAPVYNYIFAWDAPVMGGFAMSYHTAEIPFVFDDLETEETITGGGRQAKKLASVISTAWTNFAKTGSPNGKGVPKWEAFTRENGAVMIFDTRSRMAYHHDDELMELIGPKGGNVPVTERMNAAAK